MPAGAGLAHERARGRVVASARARARAHGVARRRGGRAPRGPGAAAARDRAPGAVDRPRPALGHQRGALGARPRWRPRHRRAGMAPCPGQRRAGRRGLGGLVVPGGGRRGRRPRSAALRPGLIVRARDLATRVLPEAAAHVAASSVPPSLGTRQEAELHLATARAHAQRVRGRVEPGTWGRAGHAWALPTHALPGGQGALVAGPGDPRGPPRRTNGNRHGWPPVSRSPRRSGWRATCRLCRSCARWSTWPPVRGWPCPSAPMSRRCSRRPADARRTAAALGGCAGWSGTRRSGGATRRWRRSGDAANLLVPPGGRRTAGAARDRELVAVGPGPAVEPVPVGSRAARRGRWPARLGPRARHRGAHPRDAAPASLRRVRAEPARAGGPQHPGRRSHRPRHRDAALHQRAHGARPRPPHPGQAGRQQSHRGGRGRHPPGPRAARPARPIAWPRRASSRER